MNFAEDFASGYRGKPYAWRKYIYDEDGGLGPYNELSLKSPILQREHTLLNDNKKDIADTIEKHLGAHPAFKNRPKKFAFIDVGAGGRVPTELNWWPVAREMFDRGLIESIHQINLEEASDHLTEAFFTANNLIEEYLAACDAVTDMRTDRYLNSTVTVHIADYHNSALQPFSFYPGYAANSGVSIGNLHKAPNNLRVSDYEDPLNRKKMITLSEELTESIQDLSLCANGGVIGFSYNTGEDTEFNKKSYIETPEIPRIMCSPIDVAIKLFGLDPHLRDYYHYECFNDTYSYSSGNPTSGASIHCAVSHKKHSFSLPADDSGAKENHITVKEGHIIMVERSAWFRPDFVMHSAFKAPAQHLKTYKEGPIEFSLYNTPDFYRPMHRPLVGCEFI